MVKNVKRNKTKNNKTLYISVEIFFLPGNISKKLKMVMFNKKSLPKNCSFMTRGQDVDSLVE